MMSVYSPFHSIKVVWYDDDKCFQYLVEDNKSVKEDALTSDPGNLQTDTAQTVSKLIIEFSEFHTEFDVRTDEYVHGATLAMGSDPHGLGLIMGSG
jgi:hypothetical protein